MVSALDSGTQAEGQCVVFLVRELALRVPLSTQMYKWLPANLMLGEPCDELVSHQGGRGYIPSHFMLQIPGYALRPD